MLAVLLLTGCSVSEADERDVSGSAAPSGADAGSDAGAPSVRFVSPAAAATVANPVVFTIAATAVEEVEVFDEGGKSLGAFDPSKRTTLRHRFPHPGGARRARVVARARGVEVARDELAITVSPDSCEDRFFVTNFDKRNEDPTGAADIAALREDSLAEIKAAVADIEACGAKVTLGNIMSLLLYEGGFRVAAFNTRCSENSYNRTERDCDVDPEALYSYQFGIGGFHTSNLHPCKGGAYTQKMRKRFLELASGGGFPIQSSLVTGEIAARFAQVCPSATPSAVDYYVLGAHVPFGIPKNDAGSAYAAHSKFPFFTPAVSVKLTFAEMRDSCASIADDREAIAVFGGGDASYGTAAKQNAIMAYFRDFRAESCD